MPLNRRKFGATTALLVVCQPSFAEVPIQRFRLKFTVGEHISLRFLRNYRLQFVAFGTEVDQVDNSEIDVTLIVRKISNGSTSLEISINRISFSQNTKGQPTLPPFDTAKEDKNDLHRAYRELFEPFLLQKAEFRISNDNIVLDWQSTGAAEPALDHTTKNAGVSLSQIKAAISELLPDLSKVDENAKTWTTTDIVVSPPMKANVTRFFSCETKTQDDSTTLLRLLSEGTVAINQDGVAESAQGTLRGSVDFDTISGKFRKASQTRVIEFPATFPAGIPTKTTDTQEITVRQNATSTR